MGWSCSRSHGSPGAGSRRSAASSVVKTARWAKSSTSQRAGAPTLVFDEVDAGIGGATATEVGRRLCALARTHQVIVVTHLAQVAAFAQTHLTVRKLIEGDRAFTVVEHVTGDDLEAIVGQAERARTDERAYVMPVPQRLLDHLLAGAAGRPDHENPHGPSFDLSWL